jgi:hypothetical protein
MTPRGFPHSDTLGLTVVCTYPRLIAACRVLHRLQVPRHPPCALNILLCCTIRRFSLSLCSSQGANAPSRNEDARRVPEPSKLDTVTPLNGVDEARSTFGFLRAERASPRSAPRPATVVAVHELPRKEVIQPHLPVRLPCYDFTPLTLHTFGASLPYGLGQRLRVQTTRVV